MWKHISLSVVACFAVAVDGIGQAKAEELPATPVAKAVEGVPQNQSGPSGGLGASAWNPSGTRIVVTDDNGVYALDVATGLPVASLRTSLSSYCTAIAWSPKGDRLAVADGDWLEDGSGQFIFIDAQTFQELTRDESAFADNEYSGTECQTPFLSWSPNGERLAIWPEGGRFAGGPSAPISLRDGSNGKLLRTFSNISYVASWSGSDPRKARDSDRGERGGARGSVICPGAPDSITV
jgi:WD40 repeat protein